jgi:alanyl-tRNA synthetase
MDEHRLASGAGKAFGAMGGEDVGCYRAVLEDLQAQGKLEPQGVAYDPYAGYETEGELLALVSTARRCREAGRRRPGGS